MAKEKLIRQAYPVTLIVKGEPVEPGTSVALPETEARRIASLFGTVAAVKPQPEPPTASSRTDPMIAALEQSVEDARKAYDAVKAKIEGDDPTDADLKAFEEAEKDLDAAEKALADARAK